MATRVFRIPLENRAQRFAVDLAGRSLVMVSRWNGEMPAWVLDLYDGNTREPLILCLPLVTGLDLLEQFRHVGIPGTLVCTTLADELAPPTFDNLGAEAILGYILE
jgi:hypothetical protein